VGVNFLEVIRLKKSHRQLKWEIPSNIAVVIATNSLGVRGRKEKLIWLKIMTGFLGNILSVLRLHPTFLFCIHLSEQMGQRKGNLGDRLMSGIGDWLQANGVFCL
jgi:hypothetical protein